MFQKLLLGNIATIVMLLVLLIPLVQTFKGFELKIKKLLCAFFLSRIVVETIGLLSHLFDYHPGPYFHIYSLIEFFVLLYLFFFIVKKKYIHFIALFYFIFWFVFHFYNIAGLKEVFRKPVDISVWVTTVIMLCLYGSYILRYNFKDRLKGGYIILSSAILSYFIIIITFILYKNNIFDSHMPIDYKLELINQRLIWHNIFIILSTILFITGIKFLPKTIDKEENILNISLHNDNY